MTYIYRFLSLVINTIAILLTFSFFVSIPMLISSPVTLFSAFLIVSVILYSWFSYQFRRDVLQRHLVVKLSLRDWVRVNGFVSLFFSVLCIDNVLYLLQHPQIFDEALNEYKFAITTDKIFGIFYGMMAYGCILLTHILWTFALMKKNEAFFK